MKIMLILSILTLIIVQTHGSDESTQGTDKSIKFVSVLEAARINLALEIFVLDVRTQQEYDEGHLPRATLIPYNKLKCIPCKESGIIKPHPDLPENKTTPILIYSDRSGNRSEMAAASLQELGYGNVLVMAGGFPEWVKLRYEYVGDQDIGDQDIGEGEQEELTQTPVMVIAVAMVSLASMGLLFVGIVGIELTTRREVILIGATGEGLAHIGIFMALEKGCPTCIAQWTAILGVLTGLFVLGLLVAERRAEAFGGSS